MGIDETKVIDLTEYGGTGFIEMAYPTLRRKDKFSRIASAMMVKGGKEPTINTDMLYDAQFVQKLAFIESGPIDMDDALESFYQLTDKLDANRRGAGEDLKNEIIRIADEIAEGKTSPSAGSPTAE